MKTQRKVVLVGNSLLMAGVEASLQGRSEMDARRIDATPPDVVQRLNALQPDVVIFDLTAPDSLFSDPHFSTAILQKRPGISLIGLDPNSNKALVLSGEEHTLLAANDLARAIQSLSS
jgi:DNA-binding NarL/FixJ family response regulator